MIKEVHTWHSSNLNKEMNVLSFGHYGFALVMFPSLTDDAFECENLGLTESIENFVHKGKCRIFSVGTVNEESWENSIITPQEKSQRHFEYNKYFIEEVVPFVYSKCGGPVPIILCGASNGAYHAVNHYFRRPDIFYGVIGMSGNYNIEHYAKGYFDDNCYFNSPVHYLPNLTNNYWLSFLMSKHHVYLLTGTGENENPHNTSHLSQILSSRSIPHFSDYWGKEWGHNYETWKAMLNKIFETKL